MSVPPLQSRRGQRVQRRVFHVVAVLHRWAEAGWSRSAVAAWALANSALVPGPAGALLLPLGLADPRRAFTLALWSAAGSFLGALLAYAIGRSAFASIGQPLLALLGVGPGELQGVRVLFAEHGWQVVLVGCLGLLPVKLTSIAAGAFGLPLVPFALAVLAGRTTRFLALALVIRFAGSRMTKWIEHRTRRPIEQLR